MNEPDLLQQALSRLDEAARLAAVDPAVLEVLRYPKQTLKARLTIRMDEGRIRTFPAWRCRYDDSRGPTKGGLRFHPAVTGEEVESLAFWMTVKCAIAGLPFGGAKGGVRVDPDTLSAGERERLARAYVRAFADLLGPERDIPAPDVGVDAEVMGWMADEYAVMVGRPEPAVVTGKPLALGGSAGREAATATGGVMVLQRLASNLGLSRGDRVAVQGLGNVGLELATQLAEAGYRIVAVADSRGSLICDAGLDMRAVAAAKHEGRPLQGLTGGGVHAAGPEAVLEAACDVLAPAALENALTESNASRVRARVVLEMANGPTTPKADLILAEHGVTVIPDVIANSGGVIVSYFEWLQNRAGETWPEAKVAKALRERIEPEAAAVFANAAERRVTPRAAAYAQGLSRLGQAMGL